MEFLGDIPARQSCSKVEPHRIPPDNQIYYQGDASWCYAYVTADLLSFELGQRVSAADIALSYNDWDKRLASHLKHSEMNNGGNPAAAAEVAMSKGMCLERDLPSDLYLIPGKQLTPMEIIRSAEALKDSWDQSRRAEDLCGPFRSVKEMFPNLDTKTYAEIILKTNKLEVVSKLQEATCRGKRVKMPSALEGVAADSRSLSNGQQRMLNRLDQVLRHKPVAALVNAPFVGLNPKDGRHVVTVVGRRFNKKNLKCEYMIRDSNEYCPPGLFSCEGSERWTSEDNLKNNLVQIDYLRDKPAKVKR